MNAKPSDIFINVIEFFGIVIPGGVLFFLHGEWLLKNTGISFSGYSVTTKWVIASGMAYILGHFLMGFSVRMNRIAIHRLHATTKHYFNEILPIVNIPKGLSQEINNTDPVAPDKKGFTSRIKKNFGAFKCYIVRNNANEKYSDIFYAVFSYLRMNSSEAMAELERQAAEYKLFRGLSLLFFIDFLLTLAGYFCPNFINTTSLFRPLLSLLASGLAFYRFDFLIDWTYRLAFDFYFQLKKEK